MYSKGRSIPQKIRQQARKSTIQEVHKSMEHGFRKDDILREIMDLNPSYSLSNAQKLYKEAFIMLSSEKQLTLLKKQKEADIRNEQYIKNELEKVSVRTGTRK